ncbi:MAG: ATP-binding protein [Sideroxydans sp.]|nr:ATP-binding protein [Sideroxydans sp.]
MRLPEALKDAPILRKLVYVAIVATLWATLFAMLVLMAQQWFLQRNELVKSVYAQASIVAANSTSALIFNDREAAEQTLGALAASDNIEYAGLLDKTGQDFADYARPGIKIPPHQHAVGEGAHNIYDAQYVEVVIPVMQEQEQIGLIHVRSDMSPVYVRLAWGLLVVLIAAMGALVVAVLMVKRMLPLITDPLAVLVGMMESVSRDKNYAVRAQVDSKDELGTLAQGFNTMLENIQQRDEELALHREHLEEEVTQRTARLTEAQRIAHLGNWEWDIVSNKVHWSREIYRIFGLESQHIEATYYAFMNAVHPADQSVLEACMRESMSHGLPFSLDHRILQPDGAVRYVHERAEVMRDKQGRAILMWGTMHDITAQKIAEEKIRKLNDELEERVQQRTQQLLEAQEELVRKEKLAVLGQVAGSVGHELRNPLGVMSNAVYFLQTVLADADENTQEYLGIIKSEITNSERIVSDLLDSVRTKPPQPENVGLAELVAQTLGKLAIPSSVNVMLDIPETLPPLWVDAMQIHQVLRNLISNGAEAMPGGGTLQIGARENRPDKTVTISVRDSGVGMTAEQLNRLFQPLFTTKARGIGLGLVVVKNLTQANGGTVEVESEPGKGTMFSITLPCESRFGDAP